MIKTEILCYINSYSFDGELITPSQVLTSTKQNEELNLSYTPNFILKLNDAYSYINDTVEVSFSYGGTDYTAYANVVNRNAGVVTLQYNSGLTTYVNPPTPVEHTLEFSPAGPFSCSYDTYSAAYTNSYEFNMLYDNEALKLVDVTVSGNTYCTIADGETSWSYVFTTTYNEVGEYSDTVTITYNELNAYCTVNATITDSTPVVHTLAFSADTFYTYFDLYDNSLSYSDACYLKYDENNVDDPYIYLDKVNGRYTYNIGIRYTYNIQWAPYESSYDLSVGEYTDNISASYEGLTAYCNVILTVTDSTPVTFEFNGTDYYCSYNSLDGTAESSNSVELTYGEATVDVADVISTLSGNNNCTLTQDSESGLWYFDADPNLETGDYYDYVELTYNGQTALTNVHISIIGEMPLEVYMMSGDTTTWGGTPITDYVEASDPNNTDEYGDAAVVTSDCTFSCEDQNISITNGNEVTANAAGEYEIVAIDNNTGRTGSVTWVIEAGE